MVPEAHSVKSCIPQKKTMYLLRIAWNRNNSTMLVFVKTHVLWYFFNFVRDCRRKCVLLLNCYHIVNVCKHGSHFFGLMNFPYFSSILKVYFYLRLIILLSWITLPTALWFSKMKIKNHDYIGSFGRIPNEPKTQKNDKMIVKVSDTPQSDCLACCLHKNLKIKSIKIGPHGPQLIWHLIS